MILNPSEVQKISELLNSGNIGIMPTDTIYGIHCKALLSNLVDKIYEIKKRPGVMPFITVISDISELALFGIGFTFFEKEQMDKFWPGPNTLIFKTNNETRAFRLPRNDFLISVLKLTGPLISTSANLHGLPPAKNIKDTIKYFGDEIDFYVDGGEIDNPPSSIYKIYDGRLEKVR